MVLEVLLNRLVLSTLLHCSSVQASLPLHQWLQTSQEKPGRAGAGAAAELQVPLSQPTGVQACRSPSCSDALTVFWRKRRCGRLYSAGRRSARHVVSHRVERPSDVLWNRNRNASRKKNCHCGMVSYLLELKIVRLDSAIMQLQWTVSRREKVTWDGWNVLTLRMLPASFFFFFCFSSHVSMCVVEFPPCNRFLQRADKPLTGLFLSWRICLQLCIFFGLCLKTGLAWKLMIQVQRFPQSHWQRWRNQWLMVGCVRLRFLWFYLKIWTI